MKNFQIQKEALADSVLLGVLKHEIEMDLLVNYNSCKTKEEAFAAAKAEIIPEYIAKWKVSAEISYDHDSGIIEADGKGFTLTIAFGASSADVSIKLSFLLKALKGKILETVERKLNKHL